MSISRIVSLCVLLLALGCGGERSASFKSAGVPAGKDKARAPEVALAEAKNDKGAAQPGAAQPVLRKIIYTAQVSLVAEKFEEAEQTLMQLIRDTKEAYLARAEISGSPGTPRSGSWTVRIPIDQFDAFLDAVIKLGELQRRSLDSQDITDQYFDLHAEMKNNKTEEEALRNLLEKASGKLEDVVTLRRELKDIRGKINQQQGQLQRWDKLTELATATITIHERKGFVPPSAPDFSTSIGRTFKGSIDLVVDFAKGLVLLVVALVPWLPILAVCLAPLWLLRRRLRRSHPMLPEPPIET